MSKVILSREQTLAILKGLPDTPEALGRSDVKHLIESILTPTDVSADIVFDLLVYNGWMVAATEFPRGRDGEFHFYRRTHEGRNALSGGLMTRRPQWV